MGGQFEPKLGGQFELESGGQFAPKWVVNLVWNWVVNLTVFSTIFQRQKDIYKLSERKVIGSWIDQPFKNLKENSSFEIIEMTDGNYYIKQKQRLQKLIETKLKHGICIYRIENEPFGWVYRLDSHGKLVLLDEKGKTLIRYKKSTNANTK